MKETMINEPFLINEPRRAGLPRRLVSRLFREGVPPKRVFKEAWKQYREGKRNPEELLLWNSPKRRRKMRKIRRVRRARLGGRRSRLTVRKSPRGVRISPRARLVKRSRGMLLNPLSELALVNEPRRRIRRYRRNPLGFGNPALLGIETRDVLPDTLGAIGGFIGVKVIPDFIFPATWRVGLMRYGSKGLTTVGLTLLANKFLGRRFGRMVLIGGLVALGSEIAGELLVKIGLPLSSAMSLGAYMPEETSNMNAYIPFEQAR
jgi:hypothetical protein